MSDFVNDFWSVYVAAITLVGIVMCGVLLYAMSTRRPGPAPKPELHGHVWDEDLAEYNNPLPRWWMWLFYLTIVFSLVYLVLYPGLGSYAGMLGWSSAGEHRQEMQRAASEFGPIFNRYRRQDIAVVATDPEARAMGQRLFLTHCAQCHGSDAGGGFGFPSLRDKDWLHGGDPESIRTSIMDGRNGVMPPMGKALGSGEDVKDVAQYVLKLAGRTADDLRAYRGKAKFDSLCAACHGADGKGNARMGAPNLTDDVWLYGGSERTIIETITMGRKGQMPAHKDLLGEAKVHVLAAYVYGLSLDPGRSAGEQAYGEPGKPRK